MIFYNFFYHILYNYILHKLLHAYLVYNISELLTQKTFLERLIKKYIVKNNSFLNRILYNMTVISQASNNKILVLSL